MRPKKPKATGSGDLFRARLDQIINMKHELVQLASHWRKRLGDKLELLWAESLRVARGRRVTQPGPQTGHGRSHRAAEGHHLPDRSKLLHATINGLNRMARKHGVKLWKSYLRIAKTAAMMPGR
jgi:IS5 family transposase